MSQPIGKVLILIGVLVAAAGVFVYFGGGKFFTWFGRLPGDIRIENDQTKVYIPIASCIVISIVLSLVIMIVSRLR